MRVGGAVLYLAAQVPQRLVRAFKVAAQDVDHVQQKPYGDVFLEDLVDLLLRHDEATRVG